MNKINEIVSQSDPDDVWCDTHDLILEEKEEEEWNQIEQNIVYLGSLDRWVLNGGFETYLCMPASVDCEQARAALMAIKSNRELQALESALSVFRNIDLDDVDGRQAKELTKSDKDVLAQANKIYYSENETLYEVMATYIRSHKGKIIC